jgi:hypothetical protein
MRTNRAELNPTICAALGVSCGACIQFQVSTLHNILGGDPIPSRHAKQYFREIYPSPACQPMEKSFVRLVTIKPLLKSVGCAA